MQDAQDIINAAHQMADAAGAAILPFFRIAGLAAENKWQTGFDPVTEADRAAERAMRGVLARLRPHDAILGEEFGATHGTSGLTWILDPIDGTRAFLCGAASWGVLIGLSDGRDIRYGLIDQPFTRERFEGGLGRAHLVTDGASRALAVRSGVDLAQATLLTTYPEVGTAEEAAAFRRVAARARLTRYGLDCYAYALLALGQVDLVIEAGLQPYDIAGPLAVVRAAGGIVTDWQGGPAQGGGRVIAAATPELHRAALELLNGGAA
ncbi:inositol monophosphatase family protein [Paracoccus sediminis]|uniref:Histidinol-phosphatase, inositol monophosphatase family n=1 Tax=Paracoccus sediminis TaxID=1214787 RepID=A0A238UWH6_9RHOB|nr:inositol monophosphatase family protein [Paracoccus sediminis]TBN52697.1 inositol monophosphatase family protein [Paracoccus sediminis]SNR26572.1 histidinol-phosphatase, inositol monophosphatase family [Paracoccus sediminis]